MADRCSAAGCSRDAGQRKTRGRRTWALFAGVGMTMAFEARALSRPAWVSPAGSSSRLHTGRIGAAEPLRRWTGAPPCTARAALPEVFTAAKELLDQVPEDVKALGPWGPAYFFAVYVVAEVLALPATPLTLSAGYLFGLPMGVLITLGAGSVAACIGFLLSRTVLSPQIAAVAAENEMYQKVNKAVEREGFKIILLLRLSPLLPFSISNYLFGLSKVSFSDFFLATMLGFMPGTFAYVYLASSARELLSESGGTPWYVYALGLAATFVLLQQVAHVAKTTIDEAVEAEEAKARAF